MIEEKISREVLRAILKALEQKFNLIGSIVEGEAREKILQDDIKDKGDFYQNAGYEVVIGNDAITLYVGSNVPHEQYVLGGKVPSWTPIAPLKGWVERKKLAWVDKKGKPFSITQMAYMIQAKIKREGIEERNVFAEVLKKKESWIYQQLDEIII